MINEQQKQKNYQLFLKKLNEVGVDTSKLDEKFGEKIQNATYCTSTDKGPCYDGSLVETILRTLTPYAVLINSKVLKEDKRVNQNTLVKICLLHQIGKAINMIPNDVQWEIEKRGMLYKYDPNQPSIRTGLLSLSMLQDSGILLDSKEMEALTIMDRDATDEQAKYYCSTLSEIIRQANVWTSREFVGKK